MSHNAAGYSFFTSWLNALNFLKQTLKSSYFSRNRNESKSLAEVHFVIGRCGLVSQSNFWTILTMWLADFSVVIMKQYTSDATFAPLENRIWFENSANGCRKYWILYLKQIEKPCTTVLCFVVKHLWRGRVFSPTLLSCSTASCVPHNRTEPSRCFFIC